MDGVAEPQDRLTLTGSGIIAQTFALAGRGLAVVFAQPLTGRVVGPAGVIRSPTGASDFTGPEIARGQPGAALAVVATAADAAAHFKRGDSVQFFARPPRR